jgi:arabinose-5-phosphate isomerase
MEQNWISRGREVLAIEIEGLESVHNRIGPSFDQAVGLIAASKGRVIVTGIGKSGLVGRKIAATLSSTGTAAYFMHPVEGAHGDLGAVRGEDVAIAISYSGRSHELNTILPVLSSLGVGIIALTAGRDSPLAALADVVLDVSVPREACPLNLAPTSSTTATLAMGDALAVCLLELKQFTQSDFKKVHPGGALGERLSLNAADLMIREHIPTIPLSTIQAEALRVQDQGRLGAVIILDSDRRVAGILTDGDLRRAVCRGTYDPKGPVTSIMTARPRCCGPEDSAAELLDVMEEKMITLLPVLDAQQSLVGLVHMHDLLGKGTIKFTR